MHVRILLQITGNDGTPGLAEEIAALEKRVERPEDLGLSLAEGKALTAAIQRRVVQAQVGSWTERHRCCNTCGVRRRRSAWASAGAGGGSDAGVAVTAGAGSAGPSAAMAERSLRR